jgi:hypothetical protein
MKITADVWFFHRGEKRSSVTAEDLYENSVNSFLVGKRIETRMIRAGE